MIRTSMLDEPVVYPAQAERRRRYLRLLGLVLWVVLLAVLLGIGAR